MAFPWEGGALAAAPGPGATAPEERPFPLRFAEAEKQISQEAGGESFLRQCRGSLAACVCTAGFGREAFALPLGDAEIGSKHRDFRVRGLHLSCTLRA
ncbi:hypothetical protein C4030_20510 [Clostridioides difficile]|nr:hypothetical protein [Clostridioides difficile]